MVGLLACLGHDHAFKELVLSVQETSHPLLGMELLVMGRRSPGWSLVFLCQPITDQLCRRFCSSGQGLGHCSTTSCSETFSG